MNQMYWPVIMVIWKAVHKFTTAVETANFSAKNWRDLFSLVVFYRIKKKVPTNHSCFNLANIQIWKKMKIHNAQT